MLVRLVVFCAVPLLLNGQTIVNYRPIDGHDRLKWFAVATAGPSSLAGGVLSSGWGTLFNAPREYGPHWGGFGKRYAMRLTGVSTGNAMEAGLGVLWGEDPRYFPAVGKPFKARVWSAVKGTFVAPGPNGQYRPAYARYAAITGNNFLSNAWRADSEAAASDAAIRTVTGFLARMGANAFREFWPDVARRVFKKRKFGRERSGLE